MKTYDVKIHGFIVRLVWKSEPKVGEFAVGKATDINGNLIGVWGRIEEVL